MEKIVVLCLFVLTYVLIIAFSDHKTWTTGAVALVMALFLLIFGTIHIVIDGASLTVFSIQEKDG